MLLHKCKCGKLIPQGTKYCKACEEKQQGQQSRHMQYNKHRRNKQAAEFYICAAWRKAKAEALQRFDHIDIYAYYVDHVIKGADMVHHIVPIADDWNKRLEADNLIPLSGDTHNRIEATYDRSTADKKAMQQLLYKLIKRYQSESGAALPRQGEC